MTKPLFDIIQISGQDSFKFLQGQITADLNMLDTTNCILSAYCNRQGQVITVFYIIKNSNSHDNYIIITLGNTGQLLINKIKKYAVFSKITFTLSDFDQTILNQYQINQDSNYYIDNKIPFITTENTEKYLPNELGLVELKAVSFKKGCFLGQEIIARVFYKGKPKKNIHQLMPNTTNTNSLIVSPITIGSTIHNLTNESVGEVLITSNTKILAVLQDRYLKDELYINTIEYKIC
jgi:folate-binding protein YgfZ